MAGASVARRDLPRGAPRRAETLLPCSQCGKRPARVLMVDRGWTPACERCANAIYGIDNS